MNVKEYGLQHEKQGRDWIAGTWGKPENMLTVVAQVITNKNYCENHWS